MKSFRGKSWMCFRCGYAMDSASGLCSGSTAPKSGDLSLCMNCGAPYVMREDWQRLEKAEFDTLPADLKLKMLRAEVTRLVTIKTDLAHKQGGTA